MNKESFYAAIDNPSAITPELVDQLAATLRQFPYFHAGWMLMAKGLSVTGSVHFAASLKQAAVHVWDRGALYWLVHDRYDKHPAAQPARRKPAAAASGAAPEAPDESPVSKPKADVRDDLGEPNDSAQAQPTVVFAPVDPLCAAEADDVADELGLLDSDDARGQSTYNIEDVDSHFCRPDERYTFTDWLDYTCQLQTIGREETRQKHRGQDLIDRFLSAGDELIVPQQTDKAQATDSKKIEDESVRENDDILTETLASIYLKQKQYARAINIFKKLSLKYPEKSGYFAARISEIENRNP